MTVMNPFKRIIAGALGIDKAAHKCTPDNGTFPAMPGRVSGVAAARRAKKKRRRAQA